MATVRIATFNRENFDETGPGEPSSLDERVALMRPQIARLRADIACFQEVRGQERPGQPAPRASAGVAAGPAGSSRWSLRHSSTGQRRSADLRRHHKAPLGGTFDGALSR